MGYGRSFHLRQRGGTDQVFSRYFSKGLGRRDGIASGVALKDRANTLSLICEACLAKTVPIRSNTNLIGVDGFGGGAASDGRTIFLPDRAPNFDGLN